VEGLPTIPDAPVSDQIVRDVRAAANQAGVDLDAISGTFNAAHPDPAHRQTYLDRFRHLCAAAQDLQIGIITLSSGSRDPDDMWRWHPDNATAQAWADSRTTLQALATLAEDHGLTLAVEPEHSNVVATADQAIAMLDQIGSPALKIVYDAANLLDPDGYDPAAAAAAISRDIAKLGPRAGGTSDVVDAGDGRQLHGVPHRLRRARDPGRRRRPRWSTNRAVRAADPRPVPPRSRCSTVGPGTGPCPPRARRAVTNNTGEVHRLRRASSAGPGAVRRALAVDRPQQPLLGRAGGASPARSAL
jgi:hypothetical protein